MASQTGSSNRVSIIAVRGGSSESRLDHVAGEEPLQMRACGPDQEPADVAVTIGALLERTEQLGREPGNLGIRRATLEDVFLDLTGRALRE